MIQFIGLTVIQDPQFVDVKFVVEGRFIDTDDPTWDKLFSLGGNYLKKVLRGAEYWITCVLSAENPKDIDELNKLFRDQ